LGLLAWVYLGAATGFHSPTHADGITGEKSIAAYFNPLIFARNVSSLPLKAFMVLA